MYFVSELEKKSFFSDKQMGKNMRDDHSIQSSMIGK